MEKISLDTLENYCRTCLKQLKRQKFNIQSLDLRIRKWLQDTTLNNPLAADTHPNSICRPCLNKLKDHLEFREMCDRSRMKVIDIINKKDVVVGIKKSTENTTATPKKKNMPEEPQVTPFLRIDIVDDNQDVECIIKNKNIKEELQTEEPLITAISPSYISNYIIESDSFNYFKNHNEDERGDCLDGDLFQSGAEKSDTECYFSINEKDCKSSDESTDKEGEKLKNLSKIMKTTVKKYLYTFRCDQCKYRGLSQQCLDMHKRSHLGLKRFQCSKCDEAFNATNELLKHLKKIHKEKEFSFICEHEGCGKKFKSSSIYKEHYRQNHAEFIEVIPSNETNKSAAGKQDRHICEECGKKYQSTQALKDHQYTHGPKELYPFHCKECDKAFAKQLSFKVHQLRHAGIKNFECSFCGAKKTTKKELTIHINTHTKAKKFPCPNCPKIFFSINNLRVHVKVVHKGIRRFACRFCEKSFGKGDNLRMHELLHTGEKPHECIECGQRFVQRVQLRSHMKKHNK